MKKIIQHIVCFGLLSSLALSQFTGGPFHVNTAFQDSNSTAIRFERNVNTYLWDAGTRYAFRDSSFFINLSEGFHSSFIRSQFRSFRDEQNFMLNAGKKISPELSVAAEAQSFILSDNQTLGSSNTGIHSGAAGISYQPAPSLIVTPLIGMRYDKQQLEKDAGPNFRLYALADSLEFSGYRSQFSGQINHSDVGRRYFKNDGAEMNIAAQFAQGSTDSISVRWLSNRNDFYVPADDSVRLNLGLASNVRSRTDQLLNIQNILFYNAGDGLDIQLTANVESRTISNAFRYKYLSSDVSSIPFNTDVREFGLRGALDTRYGGDHSFITIGFEISERDEKHLLERIEGINQESRIQQESRLDNSTLRRTLRSMMSADLSPQDEIILSGSVNILQYDTPASENTDDRDELLMNMSLKELHRFSHAFSMALTAEATLAHIVYLKSDKSANNNWNRIFRLSPEARYRPSENFRMFNAFEVLANYTVFDFEPLIPSVKSYSYRQVAFLDSTSYDISPKVGLDLFTRIRVFERGELRWQEFSERPLQRIEEVTFSPQLRYTFKETWFFAIGFRSFAQKKFQYVKNVRQYESTFFSAGPTTNIVVRLSSSSLIEIRGWKEFQQQGGGTIKEYSTMTMNIRYVF